MKNIMKSYWFGNNFQKMNFSLDFDVSNFIFKISKISTEAFTLLLRPSIKCQLLDRYYSNTNNVHTYHCHLLIINKYNNYIE